MKTGFLIQCERCGKRQRLQPGKRQFRKEAITFGTDNYGADHITCECGNTLEEHSHFETANFQGEFIVEWRDISN